MSIESSSAWDLTIAKCCQEPVHAPGHIQPFGALLATDLELDRVVHASANVAALLGKERELQVDADILGQDLCVVLPPELVHDLCNACGLPWIRSQRERLGLYAINGKDFDVCVHVCGDRTLIELEPMPAVLEERPHAIAERIDTILKGSPNSPVILKTLAGELRAATGYDRIMAYQFLPDGAGVVVAESLAEEMDSFLGLHFPATDIPESSRALLLRTSLRLVPDIHAEPVPLLAWDEAEAPLDLSLTRVRGTSEIHVQQYLNNMGTKASMVLALTVEEKLWGIYAFHHQQPRQLSPDFRAAIKLCGVLISQHLESRKAKEYLQKRAQTAEILAKTFPNPGAIRLDRETINTSWESVVASFLPQLKTILDADGIALAIGQSIFATHGCVPPEAAILAFIDCSKARLSTEIFAVESFQDLDLSAIADWGSSKGGGIFAVSYNEPHYFVFFRNEALREISWAGNPVQQALFQEAPDRLLPIRSFEAYKAQIRERCRAWSNADLAIAGELKAALENQIGVYLRRQEGLLIAELKHRVKNILALIRSVARQAGRFASSTSEYIDAFDRRLSALSMAQELLSRSEEGWPNLGELLAIELQPYLSGNARVDLRGQNARLNGNVIPTFILVVHELVSNAVKYGALSQPGGQLKIDWSHVNGGLSLKWQELGGPEVAVPERRGFGCELIERAIPYEFEGEVDLQFLPSGLVVDFWIPDYHIKWQDTASAASQENAAATALMSAGAEATLGGALVVEDNMLIAMEMEDLLENIGFHPVNAAPNVARALAAIEKHRYRACLLDINLKKEASFEIAYALRDRGIPFVFTTGYDSTSPLPEDLKSNDLLRKPINPEKLRALLSSILGTPL